MTSNPHVEQKKDDNEAAAVLGFVVIGLGLLAYGWWRLGDAGRRGWLSAIGQAGGYGPLPADMAAQLEWLVLNRLRDMEGMVMQMALVGLMGVIEGNARRRAVSLSGFGLRFLNAGRVVALTWVAGFLLGRGLRRVQ